MDADQPLGRQAAHRVGDRRADVTALGDVAGVAEALHQLRPGLRDAAGPPAELGRLGRESVPGDGRQHEVERVLGVVRRGCRVSGSIVSSSSITEPGQPWVMISGSASSCSERTWMKWTSIPSISVTNCGKRVQPLGDSAEVVLARPVVGERLQRRQLDALRAVVDQLLARPARRLDATAQVVQPFLRQLDVEGLDLGGGLDGAAHDDLRSVFDLTPSSIHDSYSLR